LEKYTIKEIELKIQTRGIPERESVVNSERTLSRDQIRLLISNCGMKLFYESREVTKQNENEWNL